MPLPQFLSAFANIWLPGQIPDTGPAVEPKHYSIYKPMDTDFFYLMLWCERFKVFGPSNQHSGEFRFEGYVVDFHLYRTNHHVEIKVECSNEKGLRSFTEYAIAFVKDWFARDFGEHTGGPPVPMVPLFLGDEGIFKSFSTKCGLQLVHLDSETENISRCRASEGKCCVRHFFVLLSAASERYKMAQVCLNGLAPNYPMLSERDNPPNLIDLQSSMTSPVCFSEQSISLDDVVESVNRMIASGQFFIHLQWDQESATFQLDGYPFMWSTDVFVDFYTAKSNGCSRQKLVKLHSRLLEKLGQRGRMVSRVMLKEYLEKYSNDPEQAVEHAEELVNRSDNGAE